VLVVYWCCVGVGVGVGGLGLVVLVLLVVLLVLDDEYNREDVPSSGLDNVPTDDTDKKDSYQ